MRERGGGDGHLLWIMLLAGVGLNSSGDPGWVSSCWDLVLWKEVRLLVGLSRGEGGWYWRELGVGTWAGLGVGVGLNNRGRATVDIFYTACTGHAWCYRQGQSELAVRCLLYGVGAVVQRWGRL